MQTEPSGEPGLAVVAGDVLALRGTGLAAAETWALLCQAAQALQDLFLSNGGVVGGSRAGPVVTPHTLELTPRGRVLLQVAPPETARTYLPPEYRPGRVYSDTDSEKMWMYSLGRALLDTTPRVAALTGTVSVSPSSALQSVLAAMTEPDPRRRASLMNLLDVISEYCRTRLQSKPFTHIVMDMYREVMKSPQYAARKRLAYQHLGPPASLRNPSEMPEPNLRQGNYPPPYQQPPQQLDSHQSLYGQTKGVVHQHQQQDRPYHTTSQYSAPRQQRLSSQFHQHQHQHHQRLQDTRQLVQTPKSHHYHHHHPAKSALFKLLSRNSHSHPNLPSLCDQPLHNRHQEANTDDRRTQVQSQINLPSNGRTVGPAIQHQRRHQHSRTYSQPIYTKLQHTRSSGNLPSTIVGDNSAVTNVYSDPIYALPVKPFLSSQDVRVNGLSVKPPVDHRNEDVYATAITRRPSAAAYSHPDIAASSSTDCARDEIYERSTGRTNAVLQRQHSNPQLPSRSQQEDDFKLHAEQSVATTDHRYPPIRGNEEQQIVQQQNPVSSIQARSIQGPPKPPRIITTLKKTPFGDTDSSKSEPPAKPPRNLVKNGPRARRGKAVQRAPSRLYRTVGGPQSSFNKAQCVGPEFVVRANQPPKTLCIGQAKAGSFGRIVVIMLSGQRIEVTCDPQKVTAGDLFQAIVQAEGLDENFTLGLAVLLAGDFAILPADTKLNKVAPPGWLGSGKNKGLLGLPTSFMLYLRLRFFLPSLRGIRSWISKHLLYLQIRRCILEQQLVCPYHELINLTGLALQAEFGNYNANEHGCGDYFLLEHYVPESLILNLDQNQSRTNNGEAEVLRAKLHQAHRDRRGLDSNKAEEMFITHAQALPDYGSHYYIATVDSKELEKVMAQQRKRKTSDSRNMSDGLDNIYSQGRQQEYPLRGKADITRLGSCENIAKLSYDEKKFGGLTKSATSIEIYPKAAKCRMEAYNNNNNSNNNNNNNNVNNVNNNNSMNHGGKGGKGGKKKTESNVWLAIHAQGLKLFERGGEPRERAELASFQWKDIQTLSYSKSCLVVYSKVNGKRCKFKLRMDHRKSYFAFKLTSLHHQFFLRLRSELTSLQGLAKEFGVPMTMEAKSSPSKAKSQDSKTKIAIANTVVDPQLRPSYTTQLEEYQNKENENPQKDVNAIPNTKDVREPGFYSSEEDALYAQVNVRLEPEGESRDTEDESERSLATSNEPLSLDGQGAKEDGKLYNCPRIVLDTETDCDYSLPKIMSSNDVDQLVKSENPEELYAAINKVGISNKHKFPVPDEIWDVSDVKKSLHKVKTSSLPNYATSRQASGYRTPSLPRRLGVKMGTRAIYSSLAQKDIALTDDMESLSLKSDTESSIQSLSARSTESPLPEAYVLNADIRTNDETFHITEDESMSASLAARLEELSFAEERILHTIKLERGHGGSIGLQVTEGNDGGVYVQAVSVGGSADMAGNVNKGDRIVAINGQNLLHLRYKDALKMLQSSSDTIELVLSQPSSHKKRTTGQNHQQPTESNYLNDIRFDVSSEADISSMTNKWLVQRTTDVASVQNTSSAYSSAASSAMGNHNANNLYISDFVDNGTLKSASMLLSIEDFDVNAESTYKPPVPPRRKKRKGNATTIAEPSVSRGTLSSTTSLRTSDEKRPAPPPPPPRAARRIRSRVVKDRLNKPVTSKSIVDDTEEILNSLRPIETNKIALDLEDINSIQIGEIKSNENANEGSETDHVADSPRVRSFPMFESFTRRDTINKYPPLFFTLQDFQNVMSSTLQQETDSMTKSSVDLASSLADSLRNTMIHESFDSSLDDDENDLCFRVTTTNLPFEKCLDRWTATFANHFVEKFDESNRFIFDDYIDRSNKVNARRSAGPMCYDSFEEQPAAAPRFTRVRFVIESPSSSSPDLELDDNEEVIDPLVDEVSWHQCGSSVQLTEITTDENCLEQTKDTEIDENLWNTDEFSRRSFNSILKTRDSSNSWSSLEDLFVDREVSRDDSKDSFHSFTSQDFQNDIHSWNKEGSKVVDASKAWLRLIKPNTDHALVLTEIEDDYLSHKTLNNDIDATNDMVNEERLCLEENSLHKVCETGNDDLVVKITDEIEGDVEEETMSNEVAANIDHKVELVEENLTVYQSISVVSDMEDLDYELTVNEPANDISVEALVLTEVKVENKEEMVERDEGRLVINNLLFKSTQEYKRKVFANESLLHNRCDLLSDESQDQCSDLENKGDDAKVRSVFPISKTDENLHESCNESLQENFDGKGSIRVPVNVHRNSFLENMLSKESDQIWASCDVSPKTSSTGIYTDAISESKEETKIVNRSPDPPHIYSDLERILQNSKASLKKVDISHPKPIKPIKTIVRAGKRSAGEMKCDVLNELLSNFNSIKLKQVNVGKKPVEVLSQTSATFQQNEYQRNVEQRVEVSEESQRNLNNSRDNITVHLPDEVSDPRLKIPPLLQADQATCSNGYDNMIDYKESKISEETSANCVDASNELTIKTKANKQPTRQSDVPGKFSETISPKTSNVNKEEDTSELSTIVTENSIESQESCIFRKVSVQDTRNGGTEVSGIALTSEKTDASEHEPKDRDHKDEEEYTCDSVVQRLELSNRMIVSGDDNSAIVSRISRPRSNDNDNNRAVTPVDVSDDQSRDIVTIIPGRVRSFIRYYEIQREATIDRDDSKANDRSQVDRDQVTGHQSVSSICRGLEAKAVEAGSFDIRKYIDQATMTERTSGRTIESSRNENACIMNVKQPCHGNVCWLHDGATTLKDNTIRKEQVDSSQKSCDNCCTQAGKSKRKKSVKFQGGFTVIGGNSPDDDGTSSRNLATRDMRMGRKGALDEPALRGGIIGGQMDLQVDQKLVDAHSRIEKRDAATQIQAEVECKELSGINQFAPKPDTPRLVFYCTV